MTDEKLEQLRCEQIFCTAQIIRALELVVDAIRAQNNLRPEAFDELVRGLPSP